MSLLDRTQAPPFQLSDNYSLAQPEVIQLAGGSTFYLYRELQQDAVKLEFIFSAGRWFESRSGVSHFTAQMLPKGTLTKDAFQLAESLDSLGAHLEINPGFDLIEISLYSLRKNLLASLDVLREILTKPSFEEEELRLMKEIFIQNLKINNEKTNVVASKEIRKVIFGTHHPYGGSVEEEDVPSIVTQDLKSYFISSFKLHSVYLVGKLTDQELAALMQSIPVISSTIVPREMPKTESGSSHSIKKSGSVQTSIRLGKRCLLRSDGPEYFDAVMFNHILGGFFGSRLMKNIREEKGLTYGIYSGMNHFLHDSFWVIGAEVNQKNADQAVEEIKKEIKTLQEVPVEKDELDTAVNYFIGSWQTENATLFSVAEKVKGLHLRNLNSDYYNRLLNHLRNITPAQIQASASAYFGSADLLEVRVG